MKFRSRLSRERACELLGYDQDTGIFRWKKSYGVVKAGEIAGTYHPSGYVRIGVDGSIYAAHRLAWLLVAGAWPTRRIDHVNGIKTDNRISNLRECSQSENMQNIRHARSDSESGVLGVRPRGNKWGARICWGGIRHSLGTYDSIEEAQAAYLRAKEKFHPFSNRVQGVRA